MCELLLFFIIMIIIVIIRLVVNSDGVIAILHECHRQYLLLLGPAPIAEGCRVEIKIVHMRAFRTVTSSDKTDIDPCGHFVTHSLGFVPTAASIVQWADRRGP